MCKSPKKSNEGLWKDPVSIYFDDGALHFRDAVSPLICKHDIGNRWLAIVDDMLQNCNLAALAMPRNLETAPFSSSPPILRL